ncbi:MAG: indole acetimide hydrolase [Actinomycetia bacterium]|nr:indole acetimide hydrolase [Actinomycetes bacterium]MCP4227268.1 indole acetimide hydrolase [Actinomycetes bacterium]MCP5033514.1 indole acetimide hydrolase [Actinomycetes bacterium]
MGEELWKRSATELAALISDGELSSRAVVDAHLDRIEECNGAVNAITLVLADEARAAADAIDGSSENAGVFAGVPFTVKNNIDLVGSPTTQAIPAMAEAMPILDAPQVERMKAAGAIPIARTNLPEFGLRITTEGPLHGTTSNPWNLALTAGGSSGGEAAAIATGMSPLGLGNDLGGSLRNPAFCCGISSLKPSSGRVPEASSIEPSSPALSLQQMAVQGPMARSVADLRAALGVMAGPHPRSPLTVDTPLEGPSVPNRAAVVTSIPGVVIDEGVLVGVRAAAEALSAAGWEVEEVTPPELELVHELWARNLAFDVPVLAMALEPIMSPEALTLLMSLQNLYPPEALPPQVVHMERHRLMCAWTAFFTDYPVIIGPTWTGRPFAHGADVAEGGLELTSDLLRFITPANLLGLPAAHVTTGVDSDLPVGAQIVADRFREDLCLDAAEIVERHCGVQAPIDPVTT